MAFIEIMWEITKIILAYSAGLMVMDWIRKGDAVKAFDDGYDIGYAKGKEEATGEQVKV